MHVDQVHLKKRPFPCTYDGCQQKFGLKGTLAVHVDQVHLKKRPFSCKEDGCNKMFGQKSELNGHVNRVHLKRKLFWVVGRPGPQFSTSKLPSLKKCYQA